MTPAQIHLVQSTWQKVLPIRAQAAALFYSRLFELDPSLRGLFRGDMQAQANKLMDVLNTAVYGLSDLDQLVPVVQQLGRRHAGYGVTDEHYATVGESLLWTLEQGLGANFTADVSKAWGSAYEALSSIMHHAAATETV